MKIALIGYGKMGHEIDNLSSQSDGFEIVSVSCRHRDEGLDREGILGSDVVLDFTSAESVLKNIEPVAKMGKNLVIGTTGWYDKLDKVKALVVKYQIGLVYGQNFSIGANIFFKIIASASKMFSRFPDYDVYGFEIHHTGKKDSPSGTALKIINEILANFPSKKTIQTEKLDRQVKPEEFHFASIRAGRNPGFHQVVFDSSADSVTLSHQAHGRMGFAKGALLAAEFIKDKKGFYNFEEVLS